MGKLLKRAALLVAAAGAAYAVKSHLEKSGEASGGEVQVSFEDGTAETLPPAEAEEFTDIARSVLQASGR